MKKRTKEILFLKKKKNNPVVPFSSESVARDFFIYCCLVVSDTAHLPAPPMSSAHLSTPEPDRHENRWVEEEKVWAGASLNQSRRIASKRLWALQLVKWNAKALESYEDSVRGHSASMRSCVAELGHTCPLDSLGVAALSQFLPFNLPLWRGSIWTIFRWKKYQQQKKIGMELLLFDLRNGMNNI